MKTILFYKDSEISPCLGGISRINYNLSEALKIKGYRILFLGAKKKYNVDEAPNQLYLTDRSCVCSEQNVLFLRKLLLDNQIDAIVNSVFTKESILLLTRAKTDTNVKLLTWIHNNFVEYSSLLGFRKESFFYRNHLSLLYKILTCDFSVNILRYLGRMKHKKTAQIAYGESDKIIVVSPGNIDEFIFLLGKKDYQHKVFAINNFIPREPIECSLQTKENEVVWCGTINATIKKTNWMLEIWKDVEKNNKDWKLVIIGDSPYSNSMKEYANHLGLQNVLFTGRVSPTPYYRKASILCSTSITESFGLTVVEGMQQKAVPIAFACSPSIKDIVGNNGILVKPFDKIKYASELLSLIDNSDKRNIMANKCYISSHTYEEDMVVNSWREVLDAL